MSVHMRACLEVVEVSVVVMMVVMLMEELHVRESRGKDRGRE